MPSPPSPPQPPPERSTSSPSPPTPALSSKPLRMSYRIARGEQGVLTFEPYKSLLLPHWRFATPPVARESARALRARFDAYVAAGDFVGADMARKFVQMGMTRAARYANHAGGRKYEYDGAGEVRRDATGKRVEKARGAGEQTAKMREKRVCSDIFREVWLGCKEDGGYQRLKGEFEAEQKEWDRTHRDDDGSDDDDDDGGDSDGQGEKEEHTEERSAETQDEGAGAGRTTRSGRSRTAATSNQRSNAAPTVQASTKSKKS